MFVVNLWRKTPGDYFFICTKTRGTKPDGSGGVFKEKCFARDQLHRVEGYIRDNMDKNIYFCPHGFREPRRRKEFAVKPKMLWSDMDEADPNKCIVKPTVAIRSSPGRYVGLWYLDRTMTEELNKKLTYVMDADHGGWDLTQVLRVPETINYKYKSEPRVRLLWDDGPRWSVSEIERKLPKPKKETNLSLDELVKKHRHKLGAAIRNELLATHVPQVGKRSEVLWKLETSIYEAGISRSDCKAMIKQSVWNKFAGRSSEDEQLDRELDKVYQGEEYAPKPNRAIERVNGHKFLGLSLAEIEERAIDWIWYPYLARGEVTIVEGDPSIGKSYLVQMIAKAICDGEKLPSTREQYKTIGKVAYFDAENDASRVTKNRMRCNNLKHPERFYQEEQPFTIDDDHFADVLEALEELKPTLVVFDTVTLYMGGADMHKANETTQAIQEFKEIAKRFNCAVIVVRHLTKGGRDKAMYRGQGSIAMVGVARIVLTVGQDPDDETTKILSFTKNNLAKPTRARSFYIRSKNTLRGDGSEFEWGDLTDHTSDDIIGKATGGGGAAKLEEAKSFITEAIKDGVTNSTKIFTMAEAKGFSRRTIQRAATELDVKKSHSGGSGNETHWSI